MATSSITFLEKCTQPIILKIEKAVAPMGVPPSSYVGYTVTWDTVNVNSDAFYKVDYYLMYPDGSYQDWRNAANTIASVGSVTFSPDLYVAGFEGKEPSDMYVKITSLSDGCGELETEETYTRNICSMTSVGIPEASSSKSLPNTGNTGKTYDIPLKATLRVEPLGRNFNYEIKYTRAHNWGVTSGINATEVTIIGYLHFIPDASGTPIMLSYFNDRIKEEDDMLIKTFSFFTDKPGVFELTQTHMVVNALPNDTPIIIGASDSFKIVNNNVNNVNAGCDNLSITNNFTFNL